jgi:hypothetical protein
MAPGILLSNATENDFYARPPKRLKTVQVSRTKEDFSDGDIPSHSLGIKPSGNAYSSSVNSKTNAGLFGVLPDELILQLLELLAASELLALGSTCRFLYAFTQYDELWRALFIE